MAELSYNSYRINIREAKKTDISIKQELKQQLSVRLLNSVRLLQMNYQELIEYLDSLVLENPLLEVESPAVPPFPPEVRGLRAAEASDLQNLGYYKNDISHGADPLTLIADKRSGDWREQLASQLRMLNLSPDILKASLLIVSRLDDKGYFRESAEALSASSGIRGEKLEAALATVRWLEPAGVGAANLSDCLLLQLERLEPRDATAGKIAASFLNELASGAYGSIASALDITEEEAQRAGSVIRGLEPFPVGSSSEEETVYIIPDIFALSRSEGIEVLFNERSVPVVKMNPYYMELMENGDAEVVRYLVDKHRQAQWVIDMISRRNSTLVRCAEVIIKKQAGFFSQGLTALVPLKLEDVAQELGLHTSTVCRAVAGKYMQCARGVFPLGMFFPHGIGGVSAGRIKAELKRVIAAESPDSPLSDSNISDKLSLMGISASRRTVAKYRASLGLPPAAQRKRK